MSPLVPPRKLAKATLLATHRHFATSPAGSQGAEEAAKDKVILYEGPLVRTLARLKKVSLTSCTLTVVFVPLSVYAGNPSMPLVSKIAVAATVGFFGLVTTGLLHRVSKAYVCALSISKEDAALFVHANPTPPPATPSTSSDAGATPVAVMQPLQDADVTVTAETLNIFGMRKSVSFPMSSITYPKGTGAFVTFYANGQPFFVHPELVHADGRLLGILRGVI